MTELITDLLRRVKEREGPKKMSRFLTCVRVDMMFPIHWEEEWTWVGKESANEKTSPQPLSNTNPPVWPPCVPVYRTIWSPKGWCGRPPSGVGRGAHPRKDQWSQGGGAMLGKEGNPRAQLEEELRFRQEMVAASASPTHNVETTEDSSLL